ncbi:MAG: cell division protein FtsQ/DivIB [Gaiellaceae bacterium]
MAARKRTTVRAAILPARVGVPDLGRIAPSGRSILLSVVLLALGLSGYFVVRDTSVFAVQDVDVRGGTPQVRAAVRSALRAETGTSLLRVDGTELERRLSSISTLRSFSYDRAFPHTLRVVIRPERAVLVLRQGNRAYLVAATGRVLRALPRPRLSSLPRLWVTKGVHVEVGSRLPEAQAAAATALAPLREAPLPGGVASVETGPHTLTLILGGGLELRLGDTGDLRLKLAIARRILRLTGAAADGAGYVDVSVPERPVVFSNSQVAGGA